MANAAAYYGLQDAARKRRPPSQMPGAWAGALIAAEAAGIYKVVSQERWQKLKGHIKNLCKEWAWQPSTDRKALECTRGFLVYITLTYGVMMPYLKGLHLTLESWHPDRDEDRWHMTPSEFATFTQENQHKWTGDSCEGTSDEQAVALRQVVLVPRLKGDVEALSQLTEAESPPRVLVRPQTAAIAAMMFGDVSGAGFGTLLWLQGEWYVLADHGVLTQDYSNKSSNFRELYNLVSWMEMLIKEGKLPKGTDMFIFTETSTAEAAFYYETSKSKLLFQLVLQL
ncbi:hypothetical protein ACA910_014754 [Epithemia clementina (nom. ined.)]